MMQCGFFKELSRDTVPWPAESFRLEVLDHEESLRLKKLDISVFENFRLLMDADEVNWTADILLGRGLLKMGTIWDRPQTFCK